MLFTLSIGGTLTRPLEIWDRQKVAAIITILNLSSCLYSFRVLFSFLTPVNSLHFPGQDFFDLLFLFNSTL